jgi:acetyltransferase-like isoleucine patch superfamily enzyme
MRGRRLFQTIRLAITRSATGRAAYLKRKGVFANIGEGCSFMPRMVPLYPELIRMGDNVRIASNVTFITHDCIHKNLNYYAKSLPIDQKHTFNEGLGCIEIGNNVFIGEGCHIFYDVKIGDNVIVVSGSVVTNDIPENTVVRGIPAKKVCSFDDYYKMKAAKDNIEEDTMTVKESVTQEATEKLWKEFRAKREK